MGGGRQAEWQESSQYPPFHQRASVRTLFNWIQIQRQMQIQIQMQISTNTPYTTFSSIGCKCAFAYATFR